MGSQTLAQKWAQPCGRHRRSRGSDGFIYLRFDCRMGVRVSHGADAVAEVEVHDLARLA